jgi:anti-sigma B factor antagonist
MSLILESQVVDDVVVIHCRGRLTFGPESEALEAEVNRRTKIAGSNFYQFKEVVLDLGETEYIDSAGLGALVRLQGVLRAAGGGLRLCRMSPSVLRVIEVTNLRSLFPPYGSEAEAIKAFSRPERRADDLPETPRIGILCVDTSPDVLAGLSALLGRSGYEVFTTRYAGEAPTLARATRSRVVVCGPGMINVPTAPGLIEKLGKSGGQIKILQLPSDFHTSEAGEASQELLSQLQTLLASEASA